jgi:hypothetical protein
MTHHVPSLTPNPAIERLEPRRLFSDIYEPNNNLGQANNFGALGDREEFGLSIEPGDQDFFRFTALGSGNVNIKMNHVFFVGDLDLYLYGPSNTVVASSFDGQNLEEINYDVVEGQTYTINVAGAGGNVNNVYDLRIDGPDASSIQGDRFEPNNSFAAAANLGTLGDRNEADLTIHAAGTDLDWFKFVPASSGSVTMSIAFQHSISDLDLNLWNSLEARIASSEGTGNTETIIMNLTGGETYYLEIKSFNEISSPDYDLSIDGPALPAPGVSSSQFNFETRHEIQFNFDQDVSASLTVDDLTVTNTTSAQVVPSSAFTFEITSASGAPTVALWKANSPLADGNYTAVLTGSGVTNGSGTPVAGTPTRNFFVLAGDADHDRDIDVNDLGILATNWQLSPRTFSQGDFDYTGTVDVNDLGILATKWQQQLAPPSTPAAVGSTRRGGVSRMATDVLR